MARTLPPANQGGGRLQHSSSYVPLDFSQMVVREMTDEDRARSADDVQRGKERAGLGTPELQAAHHARAQTQVPHMVEWLRRNDDMVAAATSKPLVEEPTPMTSRSWPYPDTMPYRTGTHHKP